MHPRCQPLTRLKLTPVQQASIQRKIHSKAHHCKQQKKCIARHTKCKRWNSCITKQTTVKEQLPVEMCQLVNLLSEDEHHRHTLSAHDNALESSCSTPAVLAFLTGQRVYRAHMHIYHNWAKMYELKCMSSEQFAVLIASTNQNVQ